MMSPRWLLSIMLTVIVGLLTAYVTKESLVVGFLPGLLLLIFYSIRLGIGLQTIFRSVMNGAKHTQGVIWILVLIGLLIPSWTASGTIANMINTGLHFLNPAYFVTYTFLFAAVISMILGTSTGTLSSVGIPFIGIAGILHIPIAIVAGALISGAFVGDRTSPLSSTNQLVLQSTGLENRHMWTALFPTTFGSFVISTVFFYMVDMHGAWHHITSFHPTMDQSHSFHYSPYLMLPPIFLILSILFRFNIKYGFLLSILASMILGTLVQHVEWTKWLDYLWNGYSSAGNISLRGKGLFDMVDLVILVALAGSFNGILEETRLIQPYIKKWLGNSSSLGLSSIRVSAFGLMLGMISCTQTLPIMMSGRNMLPIWKERFASEDLTRVVADSSLIFAALIPWNLLAILCSAIIGVPVEDYLPYAVFLWVLPILTIIFSYIRGNGTHHKTTFSMKRKKQSI